jgi:hypothetical protein
MLVFLNMEGGRRACMLIRERRFARGVCGEEGDSPVMLDCDTRCSTSAAEAAGAERSLFLFKMGESTAIE